jgi:hypothetical protein
MFPPNNPEAETLLSQALALASAGQPIPQELTQKLEALEKQQQAFAAANSDPAAALEAALQMASAAGPSSSTPVEVMRPSAAAPSASRPVTPRATAEIQPEEVSSPTAAAGDEQQAPGAGADGAGAGAGDASGSYPGTPSKADVRQSPTNSAVVQKLISHAMHLERELHSVQVRKGRGGARRGNTVCMRLSTLHSCIFR